MGKENDVSDDLVSIQVGGTSRINIGDSVKLGSCGRIEWHQPKVFRVPRPKIKLSLKKKPINGDVYSVPSGDDHEFKIAGWGSKLSGSLPLSFEAFSDAILTNKKYNKPHILLTSTPKNKKGFFYNYSHPYPKSTYYGESMVKSIPVPKLKINTELLGGWSNPYNEAKKELERQKSKPKVTFTKLTEAATDLVNSGIQVLSVFDKVFGKASKSKPKITLSYKRPVAFICDEEDYMDNEYDNQFY